MYHFTEANLRSIHSQLAQALVNFKFYFIYQFPKAIAYLFFIWRN